MNEDTIFAKIVRGEVPCHKVYEDELTLAFLDIHPIQPGHTLVIPKRPVPLVWDLEEVDYNAVMATARKVARRMLEAFPDRARVAMMIEGLDIPHAHVKLFPFDTAEEFRRVPEMTVEPNHAELAAIARKLAF